MEYSDIHFLRILVRYIRLAHIVLLFIICYLLVSFSAIAADFCLVVGMQQQCPASFAQKDGCCDETIEAVPSQGQPCGACYDHCAPHGRNEFHVISAPIVKRVSQSPLVVETTSSALPGLQSAQDFSPASPKRANLPNSALTALRTVVLLN